MLRELSRSVGVARPISSNRHIHDEKERGVEGVGLAVHLGVVDGVIGLVVHQPGNLVFFPNHRKQVEGIAEFLSIGQRDARSIVLVNIPIAPPMRRSVHR